MPPNSEGVKTVAAAPRPPVPHSYEPLGGPAPLSGFWLGLAAMVLAIVSVASTISKEIAARWRGIVVAHLFFLTLWLAIQVFFFATGAYWCLPGNSSRLLEWVTRSFPHVARCGPVLQGSSQGSSAFQGSTAVAAPGPAPPPVAAVPASPPIPAPVAPPPSPGAPASGRGSDWSARAIANCWRDRSVRSGSCYEPADPRRYRSQPPARYGRPEPSPSPCRRPYDCWPDNSRRYDLL